MGFLGTIFGEDTFSAKDYNKQKQQDYNWQIKSAKEMPSAAREGMEKAGFNPLLSVDSASSAQGVALGSPSDFNQQGQQGDSSTGTLDRYYERKMKEKEFGLAMDKLDNERTRTKLEEGSLVEQVRHAKVQEQLNQKQYNLQRLLSRDDLHAGDFNQHIRSSYPGFSKVLDSFGMTPYGAVGKVGKAAFSTAFALYAGGASRNVIGKALGMLSKKGVDSINFK
ncbi:hypothetical protein [Capybara microvirus Cap1_SP_140]|nr:hypothetical protein [Capybara microvirus Cap1_SP_140]